MNQLRKETNQFSYEKMRKRSIWQPNFLKRVWEINADGKSYTNPNIITFVINTQRLSFQNLQEVYQKLKTWSLSPSQPFFLHFYSFSVVLPSLACIICFNFIITCSPSLLINFFSPVLFNFFKNSTRCK